MDADRVVELVQFVSAGLHATRGGAVGPCGGATPCSTNGDCPSGSIGAVDGCGPEEHVCVPLRVLD